MGILEYRKAREEKKKEKIPTVSEEQTLASIMQDSEKSNLFGEFLKAGGDMDLGERIAKKELKEGDLTLLATKRKAFLERMAKVEEAEKWLTKENIDYLTRNHPNFAEATDVVGVEGVIEAVKSQLRETSIIDEVRFNMLFNVIGRSNNYENSKLKEIDEKIEKLLKDKKIEPQEYWDILAIEDPKEREKAMKEFSSKSYGLFKRVLSHLPKGSGLGDWARKSNPLKDFKKAQVLVESSAAELDSYQKAVGNVLFSCLDRNNGMREALSGVLVGENVAEKPKKGFNEAKNKVFDEEDHDEKWENEKKATKFYSKTPPQQEAIKNDFTKRAKDFYREKNDDGSFWARVFATFFERKIDDKKAKLK